MVSRAHLQVGASYVLDWVIVILVAAAGGVLNYISGFHRPFSLTDVSIAYPNKPDIVSIPVVVIISLAVPVVVIVVLAVGGALFFSRDRRNTPRSLRLRHGIWEAHAGCLGLCAGLAATLFITSGLKDMVGKPRPDLIARCDPDLNAFAQYIIGGLGTSFDSEAEALVTSAICRQTDKHHLDDGFAAFPSGHSSFSSAGMVYFSLWLCARFYVAIPYLNPSPTYHPTSSSISTGAKSRSTSSSSAPPLWQVAICMTPIVVALFVCSSRYADFHHAGFDIIAGAVIGTVIAWASFRLYHVPLRRGRGTGRGTMAWDPRDSDRAFTAGLKAGDHRFPLDLEQQQQQGGQQQQQTVGYELGVIGGGGGGGGVAERRHITTGTTTGSSGDQILPDTPQYMRS